MYLIEREILEEVLDLIDPPHCNYPERRCPLDTLSDIEFLRRFRFTRRGFYKLVRMIDQDLAPVTQRSHPLTTPQQLAVFTSALGSNEHQSVVADSFCCSQATVSRVMRNVSDWFVANARRFIAWPKEQERMEIGERIFETTGIRDVIGAIDGCRVRIRVPSAEQMNYLDQDGNTSINVRGIVDDRQRFLWISADSPGGAENSHVFEKSKLYRCMSSGKIPGRLVADEEYGDEEFLLKPVGGDYLTESVSNSNETIRRLHEGVQKAFGRMKRQFGALQSGLSSRYGPERAPSVILAATCLYNAAIMFDEPDIETESDSESETDSSSGSEVFVKEEPLFM
ncbi:hypothetical protein Y032_0003g1350 [Ancylostoma ceylanicum]|uniref:Putative nuclease HARBI1 n=1 Tax=Ancylostoma ceylanicum TaxID=53326 RepID=A0A016VX84_9BILA|nr:hypothetical protein Y032_0003g1350 [Ancylostoma ceylanicum]